ncbi:uncharacterized protein [Primulina eburnea]|uniref:uncharacterized protein n=1 Tax=Primulina eburnea TaxID=1245227 RepID=UPI003C6BD913
MEQGSLIQAATGDVWTSAVTHSGRAPIHDDVTVGFRRRKSGGGLGLGLLERMVHTYMYLCESLKRNENMKLDRVHKQEPFYHTQPLSPILLIMADDGKIDPNSPYYLGSGDQPGNMINHVILSIENYIAWARAIKLSLKARRKFVFVDGTITKPTEKKKQLDWDTVNSMLVSWITRTLDPKLAASIPFHDEAKRLWDYLEKRFCVANGPRLQQLRVDITNCRQISNMSIDDYYTLLMGLYDELDRLKPLHACECGNCTCDVAGRFAVDRDEEKLHQFLIGINDELYSTVRSNLLSTSPLPDLDRVYQACLQEEKSRGIARDRADKEEIHAFALQTAQPKARFTRLDKSKLYCSGCKRPGHDNDSCFKIHGYPDWWEDRNRGVQGRARPNAQPPLAAPPNAPRGRPKAAAAMVVTSNDVTGGGSVSVDSSHESPGLSMHDLKPEQVQLLLNMINTRQHDQMMGELSSFSWIIDTGASHHVTGIESCLIETHHIPQCSDLCSGSVIGAGERKDGLYYFRRIPTVCVVTVQEISDFELWHRRLGHPSDRVVKLVPAISSSTSRKKLNKACDVCPQAKHKRDSFPFETHVKLIRSDNGTEFKCMLDYFDTHDIIFQTSCVGTPQQNGRVERKHQHILNVGRALMFQGNLPFTFWGECVLGAVYLINRTQSGLLQNKTPFEIIFGKAPDFDELKVFGCLAFAHNQKAKGNKFAPRSRKCIFIGYPHGKKGWKLYDIQTCDIFVSRYVKFHENEFPYQTVSTSQVPASSSSPPDSNVGIDVALLDDLESVLVDDPTAPAIGTDTVLEPTLPPVPPALSSPPACADALGRGLRDKRPSVLLRDFVTHTVQTSSPSECSPSSTSSSGTSYPIAHYVNCNKFSPRHRAFLGAITEGIDPRSFK